MLHINNLPVSPDEYTAYKKGKMYDAISFCVTALTMLVIVGAIIYYNHHY